MMFLLDTSVIIDLLRARDQTVGAAIRRHAAGQVGTSSIVLHELYFGAYQSAGKADSLLAIEDLDLPVLDFNREDAREAGKVRAHLRSLGTPIGPYDVLIAGQALHRRLTLVTGNLREFRRVPGLRCEDWQT